MLGTSYLEGVLCEPSREQGRREPAALRACWRCSSVLPAGDASEGGEAQGASSLEGVLVLVVEGQGHRSPVAALPGLYSRLS